MTHPEKRQGSSAVLEFTRPEDIEQACYEANVDIVRYIEHLKGIAKRCEKHFPEVAEGLRGSASGIGQYLRGIDGKWETKADVELHEVLSREAFAAHMWAYEFCRDPRGGILLLGCLMGVASDKPDWHFWEVLIEARTRLSDLEPLIEKLLASSPLRRRQ